MPDSTDSTDPPRQSRRQFLLLAATVPALDACGQAAPATAPASTTDRPPLALVYRGRASCAGCSEAVANLLRTGPTRFDVAFCGPGEQTPITAATLASARVYAQPGGGSVRAAWRHLGDQAEALRGWVRAGGCYLGFCLGGYLAGASPGYQLLDGDTQQYIKTPGASVQDTDDTVVPVLWGNQLRHMYFQDGPVFELAGGATGRVLATYDNSAAAAVVAAFGAGRVGLVGPHPEADATWYQGADLTNPDGIRLDLGYDLIEQALHGRPAGTR